MNLSRLNYLIGCAFLALIYTFYFKPGGFRLPRYYMPDGIILPVGNIPADYSSGRFLEINGTDPSAAEAIFPDSAPVIVVTESGPGLMRTVPNSIWTIVIDFKFFIIFSFLFLICGFWFIESGNDIHLAFLSFTFSGFYCTTTLYLAFHELQLTWQILFLMISPALINMALRTTGKEISGSLLIGESIFLTFVSLIAYVGRDNAQTFYNLNLLGSLLFFLSVVFTVLLQLDNSMRKTDDPVEKVKRWALTAGSFLGLFLAAVLLQFRQIWHRSGDPFIFLAGLAFLFPLTLLYGTYRIRLVPFQFVLTRSILAGMLTVFLVAVYGLVLLVHSLLLPNQEQSNQWIVNLIFVLILVFFLDPARRQFAFFLERRIFRLDAELTESINRLSHLLSSPIRILFTANSFLSEVREALQIEKISLLFSNETFPELNLKQGSLMRLSSRSQIWKYLTAEKIIVTNYLTYGAGSRGEVYRFLYRNNFLLAVGITGSESRFKNFPGILKMTGRFEGDSADMPESGPVILAALLVGRRHDGRKLRLTQIRYLQEAAKLAGLLVYNYALLIQEVEKRRRVRDLYLAGQMQRSLTGVNFEEEPSLRLSYFSMPVLSVTGDYVDLINLPRHQTAFMLGDVSGHGLGTGYLVSTVRAIVRSHLQKGVSLLQTVQILNQFLIERYQGNEFITLFAFMLNTDSGEMEYVNAAHPGPYIKSAGSRSTIRLSDSQRLLGILPKPYSSTKILLKPGQRIFLYSDGVTETFNAAEEPFGDTLMQNFIQDRGDAPLETITEELKAALLEFRGSKNLTDDTSFVVIEYSQKFQPLRAMLSFLGGSKT